MASALALAAAEGMAALYSPNTHGQRLSKYTFSVQEPYLAAVSSISALSPASAALYPANLAQNIRNDSITALAPAAATAPGVNQARLFLSK